MTSNVCKIDNGSKDLAAILQESEKVAVYNDLTKKQTLQLRLLCEEIDGMLPNIVDEFEGKLWIELEDGVCKVHISIALAEITSSRKKELIDVAKNKKNAAVSGIGGKIRAAVEDYFLKDEKVSAYDMPSAFYGMATSGYIGADYSYLWTLNQYKTIAKDNAQTEDWDELEKSIIASIADDVIVSVKGKKVEIIIIKEFKKEN